MSESLGEKWERCHFEHERWSSEHERPSSEHEWWSSEQRRPSSGHEGWSSVHEWPSSEHEWWCSEQQRPSSEHERPSSEHERWSSEQERRSSKQERPAPEQERWTAEHEGLGSGHQRQSWGVKWVQLSPTKRILFRRAVGSLNIHRERITFSEIMRGRDRAKARRPPERSFGNHGTQGTGKAEKRNFGSSFIRYWYDTAGGRILQRELYFGWKIRKGFNS